MVKDKQLLVFEDIYFLSPIAAWGLFMDYSANSTVHGVKYLGERKRHWSERAFWLVAFIIAVYGCGNLIINIYIKWQQTPVIVSFAEKSTPVWSVPFPAVTICIMPKF